MASPEQLSSQSPDPPLSTGWIVASVILYIAMEILVSLLLSPVLLASRLSSPMLQMRLDMILHLCSYFLGGIAVGIISPRIRIREPGIGAVISVVLVFLTGFFMPGRFLRFSLFNVAVGGGIACVLAMFGAYLAERWMGNIVSPESRRAALRKQLWGPEGTLSGGDPRWTSPADRLAELKKARAREHPPG